jgi:hypothetical protein
MARKMKLLKLGLTLAAPSDPKESAEVTRLATSQARRDLRQGQVLPGREPKCLDIEDITRIMASSTNPSELLDAWRGWHTISPPMRKDFTRFVELSNKGARELGFKDTGAMWRSKYDMPPDDFAKELDRLWEQVRPLYLSLHAYVRNRLREKYGDLVPANGPIPADLLGNIWAQDWTNIYKLVAPAGADPGYDLTQILKSQHDLCRWRTTARISSNPWDSRRCRRRSGNGPYSRSRAIATWCVTPAPGTSITWKICGSRPAWTSRARISSPFITSSGTISTSAHMTSSRSVPRQRQRRISRSHRRHHRAVDHAGVSGEARVHR